MLRSYLMRKRKFQIIDFFSLPDDLIPPLQPYLAQCLTSVILLPFGVLVRWIWFPGEFSFALSIQSTDYGNEDFPHEHKRLGSFLNWLCAILLKALNLRIKCNSKKSASRNNFHLYGKQENKFMEARKLANLNVLTSFTIFGVEEIWGHVVSLNENKVFSEV